MLLYESHRAAVNAVAFSPDGGTLASGAGDGSVVLRDAAGRPSPLHEEGPNTHAIYSLAYLPDGGLVIGHAKGWAVWRRDGGAWRLTEPETPAPVTALAVLDRNTLAVGTGDRVKPTHGGFELWDVPSRRQVPDHVTEPNGVRAVAACPPRERVAWVTGHRKAVVWDVRKQDRVPFMLPKDGAAVALSPDGTLLAVAVDWDARLYDVEKRRERAVLRGHKLKVLAVAFSPDGGTLATGSSDLTVRLWDTATGLERASYRWPVGRVTSVAYAPDGLRLAAGGDRGAVVVWDVE